MRISRLLGLFLLKHRARRNDIILDSVSFRRTRANLIRYPRGLRFLFKLIPVKANDKHNQNPLCDQFYIRYFDAVNNLLSNRVYIVGGLRLQIYQHIYCSNHHLFDGSALKDCRLHNLVSYMLRREYIQLKISPRGKEDRARPETMNSISQDGPSFPTRR